MRSAWTRSIDCLLAVSLLMAIAPFAEGRTPPPPPKRAEVQRVLAEARGANEVQAPGRPLTIVLVADRKDHGANEHDYPRWQSRWALLLGGSAASDEPAANLFGPDLPDPDLKHGAAGVRVVRVQKWPEAEQWQAADLVVAFCYLPWNPQRIEQARAFVERGGGLVLIHSATWTMPKASPEVGAVTGVGGFQKWRIGRVDLEIVQRNHPICRGLPPIVTLQDETYWPPTPLVDPQRIGVLAASREKDAAGGESMQPQFWTFDLAKGRVFGCIPGHYNWTFDHPYIRILLLRGMAWAAGEDPYRFDELVLRSAAVAAE